MVPLVPWCSEHLAQDSGRDMTTYLTSKATATAARAERLARTPAIDRLTPAQWWETLRAYGNRCAYCGAEGLPLQKDHRVPLARGGLHTAANIAPSCQPCNYRKHVMTDVEYVAYLSWPDQFVLSCGHSVPKRRPKHLQPWAWCVECGSEGDPAPTFAVSQHRFILPGDVGLEWVESALESRTAVARRVVTPHTTPIAGLFKTYRGYRLQPGASASGSGSGVDCFSLLTAPIVVFRTVSELREYGLKPAHLSSPKRTLVQWAEYLRVWNGIEDNKDAGQRATGLAIQPYNGTTPGLKVDPLSNKGKATCPGNGN